ncbi:hypothetical protein EWM64_g9062 [Hericium alpestre]|uniref:SAGA-associated factor 11 n=1 Tax=Hericium alpestre TaxID=135208 RepID=A0A4Y9ZM93_9AGAM|nr:hypothetical protein EWM64_g9062 [Hericium alpestre]
MVDDVVMDAALQSHQEVARNRAVCEVWASACVELGGIGSAGCAGDVASGNARGGEGCGHEHADGEGWDHLSGMASNRYASHLSSCMGLGTGARRGAARSVNVKPKVGESARSASPYLGSESGNVSDDSGPPQSQSQQAAPKKKGRPPKKKDEGEAALNRKRPGSPQVSPNKNKKQKTNGQCSCTRIDRLLTSLLRITSIPNPPPPTPNDLPI